MKGNLYLGIDLGTSSVKLALIDDRGDTAAEASSSYPLLGQEEGLWEQRPQDWIDAICRAVEELDSAAGTCGWKQRLRAIGLSAQMPTMVLIDGEGTVLRNAIVWCDNRAAEEGRKLLSLWGPERHYETSGVFLDGRYLLPMYLWVKRCQPELLQGEHYLLSAGDYIYYWLCGQLATSPSTASGYGVYNLKENCWDRQMIREAGVQESIFPPIRDSFDGTAALRRSAADRLDLPVGMTVACGGADSVAGILGMDGERDGTVCMVCGSSTAILAVKKDLKPKVGNSFFVTPMMETGMAAMEADLLSTGNTQKWLLDRINDMRGEGYPPMTYGEMSQMARTALPGAEGLLFLPYLSGGEQGVLWNESLRGGWIGLNLHHRWNHMIRSVYEGICFEILRCLEAFQEGGFRIRCIRVAGPVGKDEGFMQMLADVVGSPCTVSKRTNASARGAAIAAIRAIGEVISAGEEDVVYTPELLVHERYRQIYQRYLETSAQIAVSGICDGE